MSENCNEVYSPSSHMEDERAGRDKGIDIMFIQGRKLLMKCTLYIISRSVFTSSVFTRLEFGTDRPFKGVWLITASNGVKTLRGTQDTSVPRHFGTSAEVFRH